MGAGICEVAARSGYKVTFSEASDSLVSAGYRRLVVSLDRAVERGKFSAAAAKNALGRVRGSTSVTDLSDCDLIIEAAPEEMSLKRQIFGVLNNAVKDEAILATNTSSLSVSEIGAATRRPDRVIGLHFFNPAPVMKLVEVIYTLRTSQDVLAAAKTFVQSLDKQPLACNDRAGFIVNFLLSSYLNEAVLMHEHGYASVEDIDAAMTLGTGHPMGPFELLDTIGLDVALAVQESLYAEFKSTKWAPAPLLRQLVAAGRLGRKAGRGFYDYFDDRKS